MSADDFSLDLNIHALFQEKIWVGAGWRTGDGIVGIAGMVGIDTKVVVGHVFRNDDWGRPIQEGHAWVYWDGMIIDPANFRPTGWRYEARMFFDNQNAHFVKSKRLPTDRKSMVAN